MLRLISLFLKYFTVTMLFAFYSSGANDFSCWAGGNFIGVQGGSANVYVNMTPTIGVGQNLVVDLSSQIKCYNQDSGATVDYAKLASGSAFAGALVNFQGTIYYNGSTYPFPTTGPTNNFALNTGNYVPLPAKLYLTPLGGASGVVIKAGSLIASFNMIQSNQVRNPLGPINEAADYVWNVYANNDVVIPTGGCDVSARNVVVNLPDYPGTAQVPLTVHCAQNQALAYYLTGPTTDSASTIFTNSASSPAQGIGVQLSNSGGVIATNNNVALGTVGTSPVDLGLTATYARSTGQVTAGNVTAVVGVTFLYP
ncbi:fimbrial chaperone protein [Serratia proteamaculans]|uniref:fimbrial protein n=1 Tax=Serratia proteamaculans TaxID=28151 RepID=UPI002183451A|nr:fimbrial protein [Serratia proteamaculans]CAI2500566.1 fimbrial chaperone protein [Serratia proteamaculans]